MGGQELSGRDRRGKRGYGKDWVSELGVTGPSVELGMVKTLTDDLTRKPDGVDTEDVGDRMWGTGTSFVEPKELGVWRKAVLPELVRFRAREDRRDMLREDRKDNMRRGVGGSEANAYVRPLSRSEGGQILAESFLRVIQIV